MKTALSIAGSDCSGGAGIQADLKTMSMNGVYGMTAITALTAQNTTGVFGVVDVSPDFLAQQLDAIFADIRPDAVKIGMVSSAVLVEVIGERLRHYHAENIVVDPVMVATSGSVLSGESAVNAMKRVLLPMARVITPNIPESEILSGRKITCGEDMESVGRALFETYGCAVLVKGGHAIDDACDVLCAGGECRWFRGRRIDTSNTHGTGCTLSSAIASNLAKGMGLERAIERGKAYVSGALGSMLDLGRGSGPVDHLFDVAGEFRGQEVVG